MVLSRRGNKQVVVRRHWGRGRLGSVCAAVGYIHAVDCLAYLPVEVSPGKKKAKKNKERSEYIRDDAVLPLCLIQSRFGYVLCSHSLPYWYILLVRSWTVVSRTHS